MAQDKLRNLAFNKINRFEIAAPALIMLGRVAEKAPRKDVIGVFQQPVWRG